MVKQLWLVVGGTDTGGVMVRDGESTSSKKLETRLSTGAVIEEIALVGERLHYTRLTGEGPLEGWITTKLPGKDLALRTDRGKLDAASKSTAKARNDSRQSGQRESSAWFQVIHDRVAIRKEPKTTAQPLGRASEGTTMYGEPLEVGGQRWLHLEAAACHTLGLQSPEEGAWALIDGNCLGLGELLKRVPDPPRGALTPARPGQRKFGQEGDMARGCCESGEPEQSMEDFLALANPVSFQRRKVYLWPIEDPFPDQQVLTAVRGYLEAFFALPVELAKIGPWQSLSILSPAMSQNGATSGVVRLSLDTTLSRLTERVPVDAYCILAVTLMDFTVSTSPKSHQSWLGRSSYNQRHGALSFARLSDASDWAKSKCSRAKFVERCLKVASHEATHMFGMKHCPDKSCCMSETVSLADTDAVSLNLCGRCEAKLSRLLQWNQRAVEKRKKALTDFLGQVNSVLSKLKAAEPQLEELD
eukprot:gnl/TRDRNA2_/TRDRNA2_174413_c0_seq2.p1 gnl/TRDRNA2_/TRDRNA2_174413_c0~~gnl/TRDRNA2_/TRDRNA2_174413_c0_seq2.p1  ORF type:complete len:473 (+),score=60.96 gnl/TRDRNA2_/TRDRNA2_174413_c0_seq2:670-2088(+)